MDKPDPTLQNILANEISGSCRTIAALWQPATLIALKLAHKTGGDEHGGGHAPQPASPISLGEYDTLSDIKQWLTVAATCAGTNYTDAVNNNPALNARTVAQHARTLATQSDANQWAEQAISSATLVRRICGDNPHDPTRWRGALVDWKPEWIADTLTDLTGKRILSERVRKAAFRGKIQPVNGRVVLGEVASAINL